MREWLILILLSFILKDAEATIYHVDPEGNNQNPGTASMPFATPGYGSKQLSPGDTLLIHPGEYIMSVFWYDMITPPSGYPGQYTLIKGSGPVKPVLKGSGYLFSAIDIGNGSWIQIENLEITSHIDTPYSGGLRTGINGLSYPEDLETGPFIFRNLLIHHLEITGISLAGNVNGLEISYCYVHHSGYSAVSSAWHNTGDGWVDALIDRCYLGYSGHYYNGIEQFSPWDRPDGFGIEHSKGPVVITRCVVEHNRGDGLDSKALRTRICRCRVENNFADGIKLWGGDSTRVDNTLIYGIGDGDPGSSPWVLLVLSSSEPGSFFELTHLTLHDGSTRNHYLATLQYDEPVSMTVLMRNCIISGTGHQFYSSPSVNLVASHNLFYITGSDIQAEAHNQIFVPSNIHELGTGNFFADPLFHLPAWGNPGNYHLQNGSPAIDQGLGIPGIPESDLDGSTRENPYDLGCYEFHSSYFCQTISLARGWQGFSTFLIPFETEPEMMFGTSIPLTEELSNFDHQWLPNCNINTFDYWEIPQGSRIRLAHPVTLNIQGIMPETSILELNPGWHYLPCLSQTPVEIAGLFSGNTDKVGLISEIAGYSVYWPAYGVHTLEWIVPGKAYYLFVKDNLVLVFP